MYVWMDGCMDECMDAIIISIFQIGNYCTTLHHRAVQWCAGYMYFSSVGCIKTDQHSTHKNSVFFNFLLNV